MSTIFDRRAVAAAVLTVVLSACGGGSDYAQAPVAVAPTQNVPVTEEPVAVPPKIEEPEVVTPNAVPLASAGSAQSVFVGSTVALDGSHSTDADSDALTYAWQFTSKPAGSAAVLTNPSSVNPTFTADMPGNYVLQLIVNDGKAESQPSPVMVAAAVQNLAPVAQAGTAQNVFTGSVVTLDGSASSDANGDQLTYAWTLATPAGSAAALNSPVTATPSFSPDIAGSYVASLIVSDGLLSGVAATVTITAAMANVAPVANAGPAQNVTVADLVTLDGSNSTDANGDTLTYLWSLSSKPVGSLAALSSTAAANPTFTPDVVGTYVFQLITNDGHVNSAPSTVSVTVASAPPIANAGADITTPSYNWVWLDGSASAPAPGNSTPLTYQWSVVQNTYPYGTTGVPNGPMFMVWGEAPGYAIWELKVCQGLQCSTDQVKVTVP